MAPMEGVTGYTYRRVFRRHFSGIDRFYTPFIAPNHALCFTTREKKEIDPADNAGTDTVPQLLCNKAEHFLWACGELEQLGYREVNLNLGCPSGTVVAKKKGSGMLTDPEELDRFLDGIFSKATLTVSVKTRIGRYSPEEFGELMAVFNRYPITELTIHPRTQKEFYKGHVHRTEFDLGYESSVNPVNWSGDLFTPESVLQTQEDYPKLSAVMLGRGLAANPFLAMEARGTAVRNRETLIEFYEDLLEEYRRDMPDEHAVLCRVKELWNLQACIFADCEGHLKKLRKAKHVSDFDRAARALLTECELLPDGCFRTDL